MFSIGVENQLGYGLTLLAGVVLSLALGGYRCLGAGIKARRVALATVLLPLFAVFFSHLCYCLVDVEYTIYCYSFGYLFAFWESGYMVTGGILGTLLALAVCGGERRTVMLEMYAPSGAMMLAAARIAEGFLGQGYGEYWTDESALCRFPFMVYDPYYEAWGWALFMLEALIALILFVCLLKRKETWRGDGTLLLLGLYASAQIVLESLRRDEFLRWGFVRVEEVASAVIVLAVLIVYCVQSGGGRRLSKSLCLAVFAAMAVFCVLLEFATEGRVPFLTFLNVDGCYVAMAGACVVMGGCVLWMRQVCNARLVSQGKESCL